MQGPTNLEGTSTTELDGEQIVQIFHEYFCKNNSFLCLMLQEFESAKELVNCYIEKHGQIPEEGGGKNEELRYYIKSSYFQPILTKMALNENVRLDSKDEKNKEFAENLLKLGI